MKCKIKVFFLILTPSIRAFSCMRMSLTNTANCSGWLLACRSYHIFKPVYNLKHNTSPFLQTETNNYNLFCLLHLKPSTVLAKKFWQWHKRVFRLQYFLDQFSVSIVYWRTIKTFVPLPSQPLQSIAACRISTSEPNLNWWWPILVLLLTSAYPVVFEH